MNKIEELRNEIDILDDDIVQLLIKRFSLVKEISIEKSKNGIAILDNIRETKIKERIKSKISAEYFIYVDRIYDSIFSESKAYQKISSNIGK